MTAGGSNSSGCYDWSRVHAQNGDLLARRLRNTGLYEAACPPRGKLDSEITPTYEYERVETAPMNETIPASLRL